MQVYGKDSVRLNNLTNECNRNAISGKLPLAGRSTSCEKVFDTVLRAIIDEFAWKNFYVFDRQGFALIAV